MAQAKYYSLMIVPDGVGQAHGIKVRGWVFKVLAAATIVVLLGLLYFVINYGRIMAQATTAERLARENETLRLYKYKLGMLEANMRETRAIVDRIARIAGIDIDLPELPPDSVLFAVLAEQPAVAAAVGDSGEVLSPRGLPLHGFMTRGYSDDSGTVHPGVDIAAAIGTPVHATASGKVVFAGYDSTYGLTVQLQHAENIMTLYGHNSELMVNAGETVRSGTRIALSGNTGRSTAPHLHYEIQENGKPINPLGYINNE